MYLKEHLLGSFATFHFKRGFYTDKTSAGEILALDIFEGCAWSFSSGAFTITIKNAPEKITWWKQRGACLYRDPLRNSCGLKMREKEHNTVGGYNKRRCPTVMSGWHKIVSIHSIAQVRQKMKINRLGDMAGERLFSEYVCCRKYLFVCKKTDIVIEKMLLNFSYDECIDEYVSVFSLDGCKWVFVFCLDWFGIVSRKFM